jgi:lysophospholipase L1-like esterase
MLLRALIFLAATTLTLALRAEPVRVACLGDSITAGAKVNAATESYPAQLQQMLGEGFAVKNFGAGGATLWHGGSPNAFQQLPAAKTFAPQIALVNFGINDTRSRDVDYWAHFPEFEADARKLLDELLALPTKPIVFLCLPTANFADLPGMPDERKASVAERLPRLVEVRTKLRALAASLDPARVRLVDLNVVTEKQPDVFNLDGVHLRPAGYRLLAETLRPLVADTVK